MEAFFRGLNEETVWVECSEALKDHEVFLEVDDSDEMPGTACVFLTPTVARALAQSLIQAAEAAERNAE